MEQVYRTRAWKAKRYLHCIRSRRHYDWWVYPDRHSLQYGRPSGFGRLEMALHHRWPALYPCRNLRLGSFSGYTVYDQSPLSIRRGASARSFSDPSTCRACSFQSRISKKSVWVLVLVWLRHAVGDCRRDRVVLIQLSALPLHEGVCKRKGLHCVAAEQLSDWGACSRHYVDPFLGDFDGFLRRQTLSCRLLDWDNWYHNVCYGFGSERNDSVYVWRVLLGRIGLCL